MLLRLVVDFNGAQPDFDLENSIRITLCFGGYF